MKKKAIEFFRNLFARWFGRSEGIPPIPNTDVVDIPISKEYLEEIEANEKEAIECHYYKDYELMAAFEASVTARSRGIDNTIPESKKPAIRALNRAILIPFAKATGWKTKITSGFRSPKLNAAVGGSNTSQHKTGEAVDFRCYTTNNRRVPIIDMARAAKRMGVPFDQMILYGTFLHLSHRKNGKNRGQVLYHSSYNGERV